MASIRELSEKKKLIGSINKITKAMQLVAIAKAKRSLAALLDYRSYYQSMFKLINKIIDENEVEKYDKNFWIVITSDLGLAGGYNSNIIKLIQKNFNEYDDIFVIGNKGESLRRSLKYNRFFHIADEEARDNLGKLSGIITEYFFDKKYNVKVVYTKYISQLEFNPSIKSILPVELEKEELEIKEEYSEIEFEPNKEDLFYEIVDTYIETILIGLYRESKVSENTSRRIAMENASNNGEDMLKELSITYNRLRQSKITQEISEIIGGSEALN